MPQAGVQRRDHKHPVVNKYARELAVILKHERDTKHGNKDVEIWEAVQEILDLDLALMQLLDIPHTKPLCRLSLGFVESQL
jgi:hypothetical protein